MNSSRGIIGTALLLASISTYAVPISWTDWTSATASQVNGSLAVGSTSVNVAFNGTYSFAQTSGGTNYWNPAGPYLSSTVDNAPPASDIIALNVGGTATINFSQPVKDPLIALVSWNGNTVDFNVPIDVLSFGPGFWGNGTPIVNGNGDGFSGSGELHGVIRLPGTYSSISFTHTSENWHGLTVGVVGLADNSVPEPASLALLGIGLLGLAATRRQQRA